uniref:PH domain-containing protein n=1 Tax=Timema poppense TaxID=170557 RepID=A0A7R9CNB8_TIMPO|nr:unnamed protein product [Timema poppensis]
MMRGVRRGCVRLKGAVIGIDDEDDSTFTITVDSKTFHFQARDAEERERWIRSLEDTILRHANRMRWDPNKPQPTIQDFDKKLVEADAYLQIIIDQVKALELRMEGLSNHDDKMRCQSIVNHANDMLDAIKHTIVLLQIAKNTAHPVNGIYRPPPPNSTTSSVGHPPPPPPPVKPLSSPQGNEALAVSTSQVAAFREVQAGLELGAECVESSQRRPASQATLIHRPSLSGETGAGPSHRPSMTLIVPETSYSSSEEEDFFDANEFYNESTPSSAASPMDIEHRQTFWLDTYSLRRGFLGDVVVRPTPYTSWPPVVFGAEV